MEYLDIDYLERKLGFLREVFHNKKPFKYVVFEGALKPDKAEIIYNTYPSTRNGLWDGKTYIDQRNKFQKTEFEEGSIFNELFGELNGSQFISWLERLTAIEELKGDDKLFGGGLHQSTRGAFLNVHVDYNIHPQTKLHRRLNVLIYLNKDWKREYEGYLQLWDCNEEQKKLLEEVSPDFNRCVIFETNEISYHGHPKALNTPPEINRKSIATYYYTKFRPQVEMNEEHNTLYINTEGTKGQLKRFTSGLRTFFERMKR